MKFFEKSLRETYLDLSRATLNKAKYNKKFIPPFIRTYQHNSLCFTIIYLPFMTALTQLCWKFGTKSIKSIVTQKIASKVISYQLGFAVKFNAGNF